MTAHEGSEQEKCPFPQTELLIEDQEELEAATLGRLLELLRDKLKWEKKKYPDSEATKNLETTLTELTKEYDEIPKIIAAYETEFNKWLCNELPNSKSVYAKLNKDKDNLDEKIRKAIEKLWNKSYVGKASQLKSDWKDARDTFNDIRSCRDQTKAKKDWAKDDPIPNEFDFADFKAYKDKVTGWFKDLEELSKKAYEVINKETPNVKDYKKFFAYFLEFCAIWNKVKNLEKDRTPEWLNGELTKALRKWIIATNEHFYWEKDWILKEEAVDQRKTDYEDFEKVRRERFIREAQDVEAEDSEPCE